jgi:hypothetical protein
MARVKKASRILTKAEKRLAGMRTINTQLSFSEGVSVPVLEIKIVTVREKLAAYNELLSQVDEAYDEVLSAEQDLSDLSSKLLTGVGMQYGKNSREYETVGGARQGDRRRRRAVRSAEVAADAPLLG